MILTFWLNNCFLLYYLGFPKSKQTMYCKRKHSDICTLTVKEEVCPFLILLQYGSVFFFCAESEVIKNKFTFNFKMSQKLLQSFKSFCLYLLSLCALLRTFLQTFQILQVLRAYSTQFFFLRFYLQFCAKSNYPF